MMTIEDDIEHRVPPSRARRLTRIAAGVVLGGLTAVLVVIGTVLVERRDIRGA